VWNFHEHQRIRRTHYSSWGSIRAVFVIATRTILKNNRNIARINYEYCVHTVMVENYRTGLIWKLFMSNPEIRPMLNRIGFKTDTGIAASPAVVK
jgi:hypothetical protein